MLMFAAVTQDEDQLVTGIGNDPLNLIRTAVFDGNVHEDGIWDLL